MFKKLFIFSLCFLHLLTQTAFTFEFIPIPSLIVPPSIPVVLPLSANAHATDYAYDLFDRQLTTTYADTKFTEFEFDKNSNLTKVTQGKPTTPKVIEYDYDSLNRLTAKRFPLTVSLNTTYQYVGSRLNLIINPQQVVGYFYNNLNQVLATGQIYGNNQLAVLFYSHDKVGNRRSVTYPSGKLVEYTYDANDRLDVVKVGGATIADYDWDLLDRRKEVREYLSPNAKTSTDYTFDLGNQLLQVKHMNAVGGVFAQFDYRQYDKVGNRKSLGITRPGATMNMAYGYNHIYELTSVTGSQTHAYQHDLVGNRTNVDNVVYQPNVINQYTQVGPQAYQYSDSGNLTNDGVNTYIYDEENRLSAVSNQLSAYTYDGLNRRVSKTVNGTATYFIYDGDREIEERDANGTLLADYVYGDSIDEVLTMTRGGSTHFHYSDGLGSVITLLDTTGNVVESYDYDVYGQPTATSTVGNPYMFTGRRLDFESGIYYYRNRMYSPTIGRFLQRDPIGYYDSMNLFSYVKNNPINLIDPLGLYEILTDEELDYIFRETYNRLQTKNSYQKYNPWDEARFDTDYYAQKDAEYCYKGNIYTGGEINYIGIGMYEAWKGSTLGGAQSITFWWKYIMKGGQAPSSGTYEWLERGYYMYQGMRN